MIPVRIPASFTPHIVRDDCAITPDHPLYGTPCPVCDGPLGALAGDPIALVAVGVGPENRQESGLVTGAAVAAHTSCVKAANDVAAER